ncbi:5-oxoprolinase (ATP-hydrolyzing) [Microdochium nivale]|nr:5-oxoprolinase (ATP-hydrolyzing) [Microdochium nivale]
MSTASGRRWGCTVLKTFPGGGQCLVLLGLLTKSHTIVIESLFNGFILSSHVFLERSSTEEPEKSDAPLTGSNVAVKSDPALVFAHLFMSIAEQLGNALQKNFHIHEHQVASRLSCALFSPDGKLIANAQHIPIRLGSMQFAIQYQHKPCADKLRAGDVLLTNHSQTGGTRLPDLTVVGLVFIGNRIVFYIASRGHQTYIGGKEL